MKKQKKNLKMGNEFKIWRSTWLDLGGAKEAETHCGRRFNGMLLWFSLLYFCLSVCLSVSVSVFLWTCLTRSPTTLPCLLLFILFLFWRILRIWSAEGCFYLFPFLDRRPRYHPSSDHDWLDQSLELSFAEWPWLTGSSLELSFRWVTMIELSPKLSFVNWRWVDRH